MVALPFMLLLFGIVELAMVFTVSTTLEQATEVAARRIRTGEFQNGGATAKNDFRDSVCARMTWLAGGCASKLSVDVRVFTSFTQLANDPQVNPTTFNAGSTTFTPGVQRDIVLVRTFYEWPLFTPLLNNALANAGNGKRLVTASAAFRNEPY